MIHDHQHSHQNINLLIIPNDQTLKKANDKNKLLLEISHQIRLQINFQKLFQVF